MKWKWAFLFTFCLGHLFSQKTLELRPVDVLDSNQVGLQSSFNIYFDSIAQEQINELDLVAFLSSRSSVNFKTLGPGLLSTPTFRGGDANHTQLLWNGLKINSPMLGTIDFSTIPVSQFSDISIVTGNSMNLYSSGGLGGGVLLEQSPDYKSDFIEIGQLVSSFGNYSTTARINKNFKFRNKSLAFGLMSDIQTLSNRFLYQDVSQTPYTSEVMNNASFTRRNISPMLSIPISKSINVTAIYWYNETSRSIPSAINTSPSSAQQEDVVHRSMGIIDYTPSNTFGLSYRAMFEDNVNAYLDTALSIDNSNDYQTIQNQVDAHIKPLKALEIKGQVNHSYTQAVSKNYSEKKSNHTVGSMLKADYSILKESVVFELGSRYTSFNEKNALLPFGGISIKPISKIPISAFVSASQSARFPTLNEMYWSPGGNDSLQPERGQLLEFGLNYQTAHQELKLAFFNGEYSDRIRWLPDGGVFVPTNVNYSISKGIDLFFQQKVSIGAHRFMIGGNGQYINAQGGNSKTQTQALSFIPNYTANISLDYQYRQLGLRYTCSYFDKRFISNDESSYMPAYQLSSLAGKYSVTLSSAFSLNFTASVSNLFDWQYQNMPWRPMPGRFYSLKIALKWKG